MNRDTRQPLETWKAEQARRRERQRENNRACQQRLRDRKLALGEVEQLTLMLYPRPPLHDPSAVVYCEPPGLIARSFFARVCR